MKYVLLTNAQSEALMHAGARSHKYIRRERKNGRWVYWYPTDSYERDHGLGKVPRYNHEYAHTEYTGRNGKERWLDTNQRNSPNPNDGGMASHLVSAKSSLYKTTLSGVRSAAKAASYRDERRQMDSDDYEQRKAAAARKVHAEAERKHQLNEQRKQLEKIQDEQRRQRERASKKGSTKKKINKAKKWLQTKVFTTKTTMKDPKTGKVIKSWETPGWKKR